VPNVVQQRGDANEGRVIGRHAAEFPALTKDAERDAGQVVRAKRVLEARV